MSVLTSKSRLRSIRFPNHIDKMIEDDAQKNASNKHNSFSQEVVDEYEKIFQRRHKKPGKK